MPTTAPATARKPRPFAIGFHSRDSELSLSASYLEALASTIQSADEVRDALAAEGFEPRVVALRAEDHFDLVRGMNAAEFDLVFCSAMAFVEQTGPYVVLLQTRRASDTWVTATREVFRRGVIIARRDLPLFAGGRQPTPEELGAFFENATLAIVSTHSAVGYLYPLGKLRRDYRLRGLPRMIACDSSEEVAKFVLNGLVDAGALDGAALDAVLAQVPAPDGDGGAPPAPLVQRVALTDPLPTDPIAIRAPFAPERSRLGQAVARAIKDHCRALKDAPIGVVEPREGAYLHVKQAFEELSAIRGEEGAAP